MSATWARAIASTARCMTLPLKPWRRRSTQALVAELLEPQLDVETKEGVLRFHCSTRESLHFVREFSYREPDTLSWIETFRSGAVFWDIGAAIGQFSLYAALRPDVRVLGFEPGAASYAALMRNIEINRMDDRVAAYCLAFAGTSRLTQLNMARTDAGSSMHAVGTDYNMLGEQIDVRFRQAVPAYSIDDFIASFGPPFPTHIKLDVDSIEDEILAGAQHTLADPRLASILIEIEGDRANSRSQSIIAKCAAAGLVATSGEARRGSANVLFERRC
jgi:FkbM family methyltransferase